MLITLNNGKTVSISFEKWIDMNDYQLQIFMEGESGEQVNDPFFQSQLDTRGKGSYSDDDPEYDHE